MYVYTILHGCIHDARPITAILKAELDALSIEAIGTMQLWMDWMGQQVDPPGANFFHWQIDRDSA